MYKATANKDTTRIVDLRCDDRTYEGSNMKKWADLFKSSCAKAGQVFVDGDYTKRVMEEAGFVDVVVHAYVMPWVSGVQGLGG